MRPEILYPLFAPVTALPKVGEKIAGHLARIDLKNVLDLVFHIPINCINRSYRPTLSQVRQEGIATLEVRVAKHIPSPRKSLPYRVMCTDDTGQIELIFFHARAEWLQEKLPVGETRIISGPVTFFHKHLQMAHPDHIVTEAEFASLPKVESIYGLTGGLHQKSMQNTVRQSLLRAPKMPEWIDPDFLKMCKWQPWRVAIEALHTPQNEESLSPLNPDRVRLAYDEILANQLVLEIVRRRNKAAAGRCFEIHQKRREILEKLIPYELTGAQKRTLAEIDLDMASKRRMMRLVQGDVGSGKTIVAFFAMLNAIENGAQAAIMAPLGVLARQHYKTLSAFGEALGITIEILTGREKGKKREALLERLKSGEIDLLIGTHALFQDDVIFHDLGLVVIDEQHRFGVEQRLALTQKGQYTDVIVMTATPIPRTLIMTAYGDLDASQIDEKPAGRQAIDTRTLSVDKLPNVIEGLGRALKEKRKVYWICPLISESEDLDLAAAEERFELLQKKFGSRVGLIHGQMKAAEKDAAMQAFADPQSGVDILVATTVIEVGIDVPEASIMVIEHAERFGLSQLHQLRGRVGRGAEKSVCLLLFKYPVSETAKQRLQVMRQSDDGFHIAEEDLKLRGAGEVLGKRQSGLPNFKIADFAFHHDLIKTAYAQAQKALAADPELTSERGQALRVLLYLFSKDEVVNYLRSG
ncbi:MAG: ATP-dependent DNA helicase RecG [Alphaproteobacteria bacterium]